MRVESIRVQNFRAIEGEVGVRRILSVLSLAKKYGAAAVDEACAAALEIGVQEYRFMRRYLEHCPQAPSMPQSLKRAAPPTEPQP